MRYILRTMLAICATSTCKMVLPKTLNMLSMHAFLDSFIDHNGDARHKRFEIDFSKLRFIDPVGVVVLSNLIEYLRRCGAGGALTGLYFRDSDAICYLDDCGFFARYNDNASPLRHHAAPRTSSMPLRLVENIRAQEFLRFDLIPWMAQQLETTSEALGTVSVCVQEILQNIADHSGVGVGCAHAQYFAERQMVEVAISDFGHGIPMNVRKVIQDITDTDALKLACEEGFTTKSNVHNRGAGLPTLIKYLALHNRGGVWISSGSGNISATHSDGATKLTGRSKRSNYPGTLVLLRLKSSAIEALAVDVEPERFEW
ncbi:histidine kinase [Variovorax paradoxus]|nr:histidine kinase [Variovorax paradoxus]